MVSQETLNVQPFSLTASIAEELCSLPAVATFGWMKRAAEILARLHPGAVATIILARDGGDHWVVPRDFTGSVGAGRSASSTGIVRGLLDELRTEPILSGLGASRAGTSILVRTSASGDRAWMPSRMMLRDQLHRTRLTMLQPLMDDGDGRRVLMVDLSPGRAGGRLNTSTYLTLEAIMPLLARRVVKAFADSRHAIELSPREGEVLRMLQQGKTVKQIAFKLQRSPHTVHDHVKSLHRKLGACNRGELLAKTFGLFERED